VVRRRAEPLGEHRVRRQAPADPQVEAGAVLGVLHAEERDVVGLVRHVRQPGDHALVLARQVRERLVADPPVHDLLKRGRGVDDLVGGDAGNRAAEHHARAVAAGLGRLQPDRLQFPPDGRHVLDADPVELDVLPVGDVGGVPGVPLRDVGDRAQLGEAQLAAVDADPQHEVLVLELVRLQDRGTPAVDASAALGVEPPPAEAAAQVGRVDRGEPAVGVDVLDARPHVERVVVLLRPLVRIERLPVPERPLPLAARLAGAGGTG
jgi:hypothetical protein